MPVGEWSREQQIHCPLSFSLLIFFSTMSKNPLLSIHYDGEIVYDEEGSIVFKSGQRIITYMTPEVNSLTALKNLILYSVGQPETKRVKKITTDI